MAGAKLLSDGLKKNRSLQSITFINGLIGLEGSKYLADVLKINTSITSLDFYGEVMPSDAIKLFTDALDYNSTLQLLCFNSNEDTFDMTNRLTNINRNPSQFPTEIQEKENRRREYLQDINHF